jgi:CBS domain containing-hemolysin-like protein
VILVALLLVALNGFFVATEFAIVKVRATRIRELSEDGHATAAVAAKVISRLDAYLSACQLGVTLASLGLGWIGEPAFAHLFEPLFAMLGPWAAAGAHAAGITVAFVLITVLHIVLGELAPKALAIRFPERTTLVVARPVDWFFRVFYPAIWVLNGMANGVLRLLGLPVASSEERAHSEEELRILLAESLGSGAQSERRRLLVEQALDFPTRRVRQIMVPRADVAYLDLLHPLPDILETARREAYTRYPLCRDHLDEVVGIVHVRDLFAAAGSLQGSEDLVRLARDPLFVPETATADQLLRLFQSRRLHMAIVVDEYGGTAGLVTIEDILEEIVGEIADEYDTAAPEVTELPDGAFRVLARMHVDDFADLIGTEIESEEEGVDTVLGLVAKRMGRVPIPGSSVELDGWRLTAEQGAGRRNRIGTVLAQRTAPLDVEAEEDADDA